MGAIEELNWPLDRIVHAEVWATDTIPADFPQMVEFKAKADSIIKEKYGVSVEHIRGPWTYEKHFYREHLYKKSYKNSVIAFPEKNGIYGFPVRVGPWCNSALKRDVLEKIQKNADCVYIGIASDETERLKRLNEKRKSPLEASGWTEAKCREWCEANGLLSPIYTTSTRGGCWFCHNQGVNQLRLLRKNYPEYWALMLKWDKDSPISFHCDGHTVHDFEHRFQLEDDGLISPDDKVFRWSMLDNELNYRLF